MGFRPHHDADFLTAASRSFKRVSQKTDAIIFRAGRGPASDIFNPCLFKPDDTDFGHNGNWFAVCRDHQKPWPGWAFPELRFESAEVTKFRFGRDKERADILRSHECLKAIGAVFKFGGRKPAGRGNQFNGFHLCGAPAMGDQPRMSSANCTQYSAPLERMRSLKSYFGL